MITSIKHPLVFVSLVLSDVLENSFCLWSLARNVKRTNRVSPELEEENDVESRKRKSFTRRSSNASQPNQEGSQPNLAADPSL